MVFLGPEQMTIVNTNSTIHSGLLVTDNGDDLDVDLELIGGRTLRMSTAGDELGTWPIEDCIIEPGNDGSFRLRVDGDETVFTPRTRTRLPLSPLSSPAGSRLQHRTLTRTTSGIPVAAHQQTTLSLSCSDLPVRPYPARPLTRCFQIGLFPTKRL
jgi:hypothetical protein